MGTESTYQTKSYSSEKGKISFANIFDNSELSDKRNKQTKSRFPEEEALIHAETRTFYFERCECSEVPLFRKRYKGKGMTLAMEIFYPYTQKEKMNLYALCAKSLCDTLTEIASLAIRIEWPNMLVTSKNDRVASLHIDLITDQETGNTKAKVYIAILLPEYLFNNSLEKTVKEVFLGHGESDSGNITNTFMKNFLAALDLYDVNLLSEEFLENYNDVLLSFEKKKFIIANKSIHRVYIEGITNEGWLASSSKSLGEHLIKSRLLII